MQTIFLHFFLSFLLVILVLWNSCLQLVWCISCPKYGCILLVRLWCFLQASQEPKKVEDLESEKKWYNCALLSFSLIFLPYCSLSTFHSSSMNSRFPNLPLDQPVARYLLFPRWLLHLCRERRERRCEFRGNHNMVLIYFPATTTNNKVHFHDN